METLIASALTGAGATAGITGGAAMAAGVMPVAGTAGLSAATAGTIASGITQGFGLLSALGSAQQQAYSAQAQAEGVKAQAYQERLKAQEEGNLRRERLLRALASQNVMAGAGGLSGGSVEALRLQSVSDFSKEQRASDVQAGLQQDIYSQRASSMIRAGKQARTASLLSLGQRISEIC